MAELAFLEIRVGGRGVTEARDRLKEMTTESERAERAAKKLADATERAEERKARAAVAAAEKADRAATTAAINDGRYKQRMADDAAKYAAKVEAAEARKAAASVAAAARAERAATNMAIREGIARERMATDAAKYAAKVDAAARKQEQSIRESGQRELAEVKKWLMTEEEALRESYLRRRRIIESQATGSQKQVLLSSMDYKYNQDLLTLRGSRLDSSKYGKASAGTGFDESAAAGIRRLAVQYIGLQAAIGGFRKLIDVNRQFDKLSAGLVTATGSAEGANHAFGVLQDFASKTPFSLRETTGAFVKLVNYGLTPSERAMRAYGNTASALGKDLDQMVEAVADAQTGEFERLKEFGVKAKQEGDRITFTFRGVSTTVNKTSKEIQEYLVALGETNFSDAMSNRMDTLDGKLSNLGDAWDKMFRAIGESNVGDLIKDFADTGIAAIEGLTEAINGPTMSNAITGLKSFFVQMAGDIDKAVGYVTFDKERVRRSDETTKALHRQMEVERQSADNTREFTKALRENEKAAKDRLAQYAKGEEATALASFNQSMMAANLKFAESEEKRREQQSKARAQRENTEFAQLVEKLRSEEEAIEQSYSKRQALIDKKTRSGSEINVKLTFANVQTYENELANTKAAKLKEAQQKEIDDLEESLKLNEDVERASYEKRRAMILKNVDDEVRAEALLTSLSQKEAERRLAVEDEKNNRLREKTLRKESLFTPYQTEIEQIQQGERRKLEEYQKARDENLINEAEYQYLRASLHKKTEQDILESDMKNKGMIAANSAALFGNLAMFTKNLGGQQSDTYKGLFAMSKAFSVAQATMSIATGTAKALELGWPAGIAAGLQVAAQGAGILAQITSSNYSGAYDAGGYIPAGRIGLVGERGPELVQGPATVTGRQDTAAVMRSAAQGGGDRPIAISIINAPDTRGAAEFARSTAGDMTYLNSIKRNASAIRQILGVTQ